MNLDWPAGDISADTLQSTIKNSYLAFQCIESGMPLTCSLHDFVSGIYLSEEEIGILAPVETPVSQHIYLVNDTRSEMLSKTKIEYDDGLSE